MSPEELKDFTILARQIQWQYKIAGYTDEAIKSIIASIRTAKADIRADIETRPVWSRPEREDEIYQSLDQLEVQLGIQISDAATVAGEYSYPEYNAIMSFDGAVVGFNQVTVSPEQLRAMISAPVDNRYLGEWIGTAVSPVRETLNAGLLKGEGIPDLVKRVELAWDGTERDAISITRTYVAEVNNNAAQDVYQANSDIVKQEEWNATLEVSFKGHGTCLRCAGLDGRRYDVGGSHPRPPLHLRCRCFMLPVTVSYEELGLDIEEIEAVARPFTEREGKIPIDVGGTRQIIDVGRFQGDFRAFLDTRSVKYQKDLLGPGRYGMLKEGKITWKDLVDRQGNLRLLPQLKEMGS